MRNRLTGLGLATSLLFAPGVVLAQESGIAIDHKAVDCIVVGKFPKMNACFNPSPNVARARVYFRPEGVPSWYYVEMKSDAPCLAGILPKPRKELLGKKIDYYVQVTDKSFAEARTLEYHPLVVNGEGECKDKPVAPFLNSASVQVFPGIPAGFAAAGGIGTAAAVGIGVGVAGIAGGAVAIANNNDDNPPATTAAPGTTAPPVTTVPPTTAPPDTTQPQQAESFDFKFKVSPTSGTGSVDVTLDMCDTTPKGNKVAFVIDFGDDGVADFPGDPNKCKDTRTITLAGVQSVGGTPKGGRIPCDIKGFGKGRALDICTPATTTPPQGPTKVKVRGCGQPKDNSAPEECKTQTVTVNPGNNLSLKSRSVHVKPKARATKRRAPNVQAVPRRLAWNSDLAIEGGTGQIVANGAAAVFAGKGRSSAVASGRKGENRIEAQLVQGAGKPGTWRFELSPTASFESGSLRVLAGQVAQVTGDAIVFQLKGTPGERIVFTFRTTN